MLKQNSAKTFEHLRNSVKNMTLEKYEEFSKYKGTEYL